MFNLKGRVAVISGASSGLGMQMSFAFARNGADLVILARRYDRLEQLKKKLEAFNVRILALKCDVTKTEDIELKTSWLTLTNIVYKVNLMLLDTLGIKVPNKM